MLCFTTLSNIGNSLLLYPSIVMLLYESRALYTNNYLQTNQNYVDKKYEYDLGYSLKNIPIPSKRNYLKSLMEKVESLIKRMRWKAYFFDKDSNDSDDNQNLNFGFKSNVSSPANALLTEFENDLYEMIQQVEFRNIKNDFQSKMNNDLEEMRTSKNLFVFTDKTNNIYELPVHQYDKLLKENITKSYQKCDILARQRSKEDSRIVKSRFKNGRLCQPQCIYYHQIPQTKHSA